MRHLPNVLTVFRLLITPVIVWLIVAGDHKKALILFAISGVTDTVDGTLARRFGWTSRFGALADPVADKALLTAVFLALGWVEKVPSWLVWIVLVRDLAILAVAVPLKISGRVAEFSPSSYGKASTFAQLLTAGAVLLGWPPDPAPFFWAVAILAIFSGLHYAYQIRKKLN